MHPIPTQNSTTEQLQVGVLSVGTEVTRGELINTNAAWLADEITRVGAVVAWHVAVDDNIGRIQEALSFLAAHTAVTVCTGGLGPTTDDLTTEAVATWAELPIVRDDTALRAIEARFTRLGRTMSPSNSKQADFPAGASIVRNDNGTAPGFKLVHHRHTLFCLPGVPGEMRPMFSDSVAPWLAERTQHKNVQISLRTFGLPESKVGELLRPLEKENPQLTLAYRATFPEIEVKVQISGQYFSSQDETLRDAERLATSVRTCLGDVVYGVKEDTYASVVLRELRAAGLTIGVAESCTGGLVCKMLTDPPGASSAVVGGIVCYANTTKTALLDVTNNALSSEGAVSETVVRQMAEGARRALNVDLALAISGIAGPEGGSDEKPVGTVWFALASARGTQTFTKRLFHTREQIRTLAAYVGLDAVRKEIRALGHAVLS